MNYTSTVGLRFLVQYAHVFILITFELLLIIKSYISYTVQNNYANLIAVLRESTITEWMNVREL